MEILVTVCVVVLFLWAVLAMCALVAVAVCVVVLLVIACVDPSLVKSVLDERAKGEDEDEV